MPINKNHEFEELDGVKCAIVEKNATDARVNFLKDILEFNGFEVIVIPSPPPKTSPAQKPAASQSTKPAEVPGTDAESPADPLPEPEKTFTIGVTNLAFNPVNAIFGRLLKTKSGHIVTQAYWEGRDPQSRDEVPYFEQIN